MNAELAKRIWASPDFRSGLKKEVLRLLLYVTVPILAVACSRYFREKPIMDGIIGTSIGMIGVILLWLVSAIRTIRAVLREHGLLER
jgi:uncharacterized membrane protein